MEYGPPPDRVLLWQKRMDIGIPISIIQHFLERLIYALWFVGVAYYHGADHFTLFNALYFSVVTFTTVGYGDFVPPDSGAKVFTCFFILLGLMLVGYFFVVLGQMIVDGDQHMRDDHENRVVGIMSKITNIRTTSLAALKRKWSIDDLSTSASRSERSVNGCGLSDDGGPGPDGKGSSTPLQGGSSGDIGTDIEARDGGDFGEDIESVEQDREAPKSIDELRGAYLQAFEFEFRNLRRNVLSAVLAFVVVLVVGALVMGLIEHWSAINALYWACVTITTVGYGDVHPHTAGGKAFTILYCIVGCIAMTLAWKELVKFPIAMKYKKNELAVINQFDVDISADALWKIRRSEALASTLNLTTSSPDEISKIEFLVGLLFLMGKISHRDIMLASNAFDRLDRDCTGTVSCDQEGELEAQEVGTWAGRDFRPDYERDLEHVLAKADNSAIRSDTESQSSDEDISLWGRVQSYGWYLFTGQYAWTISRAGSTQKFTRLRNDELQYNCAAIGLQSGSGSVALSELMSRSSHRPALLPNSHSLRHLCSGDDGILEF